MLFSRSLPALLAMAASVLAQKADFDPIYTPDTNELVPAGSPYKVTWDSKNYPHGTIRVHLVGGASQGTLQPIMDIASGIKNSDNSYMWNVAANLGDKAMYGLVFTLENDPSVFQYSKPFRIRGSGVVSSSAAKTSASPSSKHAATSTTTRCNDVTVVSSTVTKPATTSVVVTVKVPCGNSTTKAIFRPSTTHGITKPSTGSGSKIPSPTTHRGTIHSNTTGTLPTHKIVSGGSLASAGSLSALAGLAVALLVL